MAVVHVDLDGMTHIFRAHNWPSRSKADGLFESGFTRMLEVLEETEDRATVFMIAEDLKQQSKRRLAAEALRRGHEIGSHTVTHRRLTGLSARDRLREIRGSRSLLSDSLGVDVRAFRAPGFQVDGECLRMIDDAGYAFDSSVFPTRRFARRLGVESIAAGPHRPLAGRSIIEVPLPAYSPLPFSFHPSYSLVLGLRYFRIGLHRALRVDAPLVLLFHLTDFADPLPNRELPCWRAKIYTLSHLSVAQKIERCRTMIRMVKEHYQIVQMDDLLAPLSGRLDGVRTKGATV